MKKFTRLLTLLLAVIMLTSTVLAASISVTVVDDSDNPVQGATVTATINGAPESGTTGDDGVADLDVLRNNNGDIYGQYTVSASKEGYEPAEVSEYVSANGASVKLILKKTDTKYTVVYMGNGGTKNGKTSVSSTWTNTTTVTLKGEEFAREGFTFLGWSTNANAASAEYSAGQHNVELTFDDNNEATLYAVWAKNISEITKGGVAYKVEHYLEQLDRTYAIDNTSTETKFVEVSFSDGEIVKAPTVNAVAKSFAHYSENTTHDERVASGEVYKPGEVNGELNILTLKLYYDLDEYTVEYHGNGGVYNNGKTKSTSTVKYGGTMKTKGDIFTREGYTFLGWATSDAATAKEYDAAESFTLVEGSPLYAKADDHKVIKLYAVWAKNASVVTPVSAAYKVEHHIQKPDGTYELKETEFPLYGKIGDTVTATAKAYAGYKYNADKSTASGEVVAPAVAEGATDISGVSMLTLVMKYDIAEVTVDLNEVAVKYLVQKDTLPHKYKETYTVNVYEYGPGYGYRGYRPGKYVSTLSATFEKMKPMQKPGVGRPHNGKFTYIYAPVLKEFENVYKHTLSSKMSVVHGKSTLTFDKVGTYYYKLVETDNRTPYMEYVSAAYLKIEVKYVDGVLKACYTPVKITNVYDKNANVNGADNSSVKLTKVDSVDKTKVLQGAEFKLYQEGKYQNYEYFKTYTTDYNGEIEIYNLAAGDYYFVEVTAPVGYELDDSKIEFTIGKTAKTNDVELTVTNKKINVFTEEHFAYIQGYEDGTVRPQNNITRAEAATILFRLLNDNVRAQYWDTVSSYADVPVNAWYNNAVATLENMGVLEVGANYRPNDYITRAELAFMITNFYDLSALDIDSVYLSDIAGHVYETAIKQAAAMGWVKGYTDSSFNPNANITRAEAMTLINRVLERAVEERGMCAGMKTFPDNPVSAWYYEDVQEATNSHTYTRTTTLVDGYDFYYESWGSIQANPDWTALETTWAK